MIGSCKVCQAIPSYKLVPETARCIALKQRTSISLFESEKEHKNRSQWIDHFITSILNLYALLHEVKWVSNHISILEDLMLIFPFRAPSRPRNSTSHQDKVRIYFTWYQVYFICLRCFQEALRYHWADPQVPSALKNLLGFFRVLFLTTDPPVVAKLILSMKRNSI